MLHKFLSAERKGILELCAKKLTLLADSRTSSAEMEKGLPVFYDELIDVLRLDEENPGKPDDRAASIFLNETQVLKKIHDWRRCRAMAI